MKRFNYPTYKAVPPPGFAFKQPELELEVRPKVQPHHRNTVPQPFIEAMKRLQSDMCALTQSPQKASIQADKWKSSFNPLGEKEVNAEDRKADDSESLDSRTGTDQVYDPYSPLSSDTEPDLPKAMQLSHAHSQSSQDNKLQRRRLSPSASGRWDIQFRPGSESRVTEEQVPDPESTSPPRYGSASPDGPRHHDSSSKHFPGSYEELRANGEEQRRPRTEYQREMSHSLNVPPEPLKREYEDERTHRSKAMKLNPVATSNQTSNKTSNSNKVVQDKTAITCELCDVVCASGEELMDHLDSKGHWDTMEHIQRNNKYSDVMIAFLQDVLLYKSQQCSPAVQRSAHQVLQENDHLTKVEMFHCAPCKVFVFTSATEVNTHITSQEHLSNTKEFEEQQRHLSLSRAETIIEALQPQFDVFLQGGTPFE